MVRLCRCEEYYAATTDQAIMAYNSNPYHIKNFFLLKEYISSLDVLGILKNPYVLIHIVASINNGTY